MHRVYSLVLVLVLVLVFSISQQCILGQDELVMVLVQLKS